MKEHDPKLRGLELKLALALVLPVALGAVVFAFLPWNQERWPFALGIGLLAAFGSWLWLRHGIVRRLGVVAKALETRRAAELSRLPAGGGWGELSDVGVSVSAFLSRQRTLDRDLEELETLRALLARLSETAARWADTEETPAWRAAIDAPAVDPDALQSAAPKPAEELVLRLEDASARLDERRREHAVVAGLVRGTVVDAEQRLRELSSGAERQFLETTSLLTVLRELKRWSGELEQVVESVAPMPSPAAEAGARAQALVHEGLDHAERWALAAAISASIRR